MALDSGVNLDEPCEITVPDLEEGSQVAGLTSGRYAYTQTADHDDAGVFRK